MANSQKTLEVNTEFNQGCIIAPMLRFNSDNHFDDIVNNYHLKAKIKTTTTVCELQYADDNVIIAHEHAMDAFNYAYTGSASNQMPKGLKYCTNRNLEPRI